MFCGCVMAAVAVETQGAEDVINTLLSRFTHWLRLMPSNLRSTRVPIVLSTSSLCHGGSTSSILPLALAEAQSQSRQVSILTTRWRNCALSDEKMVTWHNIPAGCIRRSTRTISRYHLNCTHKVFSHGLYLIL